MQTKAIEMMELSDDTSCLKHQLLCVLVVTSVRHAATAGWGAHPAAGLVVCFRNQFSCARRFSQRGIFHFLQIAVWKIKREASTSMAAKMYT